MKQEIKELKKVAEAKEKELKQYVQGEFKKLCGKLFETYPTLESFGWNQSTPKWNDGSECNFSVNSDDITINGIDSYEVPKELEKAASDISNLLSEIPENLMEQVFGNNKEITVKKDKVIIKDYDCEY